MASSSESEDEAFMAIDGEDAVDGTMEQDDEAQATPQVSKHNRSMSELPEEVLEYILSFLSPYQEHKTAALVCKQWYRLIKGKLQRSARLWRHSPQHVTHRGQSSGSFYSHTVCMGSEVLML